MSTIVALANSFATHWPAATETAAARPGEAARSSGAVVDLSQARAVVCIAGEHSRDLLAMGCPLDLHHRDFAAGCCAQSLLGQVNALLHLRQEADAFDLFVARSYALSVWDWLTDGAAGFGYRVPQVQQEQMAPALNPEFDLAPLGWLEQTWLIVSGKCNVGSTL